VLLFLVLGFPVILTAGYALAFVLSGRDREVLAGPAGFALYLALLSVPFLAVLFARPGLPGEVLGGSACTSWWALAGVACGVALWGVQAALLARRSDSPGSPIWVGPPGRVGFALMMTAVGYIVFAEEFVWRGWLLGEVGLVLSAGAFALHHYHFGWRHVAFSFAAGLAWGGLFLAGEGLWAGFASHLVYNGLAWAHLRRRARQALDTGATALRS
jgi:membrane protease YdiL (CAAX protease family)